MKYFNIVKNFDIEDHTENCNVSYRGGNLKVDVSEIFTEIPSEDAIMGAYQNYLGGGIAGAIIGGAMFEPSELLSERQRKIFYQLKEKIKQYFYTLNAGGGDDYMVEEVNSYNQNQSLPVSAY